MSEIRIHEVCLNCQNECKQPWTDWDGQIPPELYCDKFKRDSGWWRTKQTTKKECISRTLMKECGCYPIKKENICDRLRKYESNQVICYVTILDEKVPVSRKDALRLFGCKENV